VKLKRSWGSIAADISAEGVKGARGKEPYAKSVRRIWQRVSQDVAAARERELTDNANRETRAEKRRQYPSRVPKDLRPIPALPAISESRASVPATGEEELNRGRTKIFHRNKRYGSRNFEKMDRRNKWVTRNDRHLDIERDT
jgi:hypothetical protein